MMRTNHLVIAPKVDDLLFQFRTRGFCVLENVIPPERNEAIRGSVTRTVRKHSANYPGAPENVGFVPSLINHDQSFADYLADPRLMMLLGELFGEHIRISYTSAIINEPGNQRGDWHADWPFNQRNAGRLPAPYSDAIVHVTTLWMLSAFEKANGGTLVLPGSHRSCTNPTAADGPDPRQRFHGEINVSGSAGSVLFMDSRLWHATSPNQTNDPRVALAVRYAPWWLNLEVLRPESDERKRMCDEAGATDNIVPSVRRDVFEQLPDAVRPLYRHWVEH